MKLLHTKELTLACAYDMGLAYEMTKQNAQQWSHKSFKAKGTNTPNAYPAYDAYKIGNFSIGNHWFTRV